MADKDEKQVVAEDELEEKKATTPKAPPPPNASAPWLGTGSSSWSNADAPAPGAPGKKG